MVKPVSPLCSVPRRAVFAVMCGVVILSAQSASACSIWEPAEYPNGTVGRAERQAADFAFLGRVVAVNGGAQHPRQLRFERVADLKGTSPAVLTADGDFWKCSFGPMAVVTRWQVGDLAVVYGRRVGLLERLGFNRRSMHDRVSWDGIQLTEAVPARDNRDGSVSTQLASALRRHAH